MSGEALLFMLASWGIIYGLMVFCFTMLFNNPPVQEAVDKSEREPLENSEEEIT